MKVAVYTIALDEAPHAERWANSCADADYRIVADTGSTDDTVERLTACGVTVHKIAVRPWRFDVARNAAMALIPADADVCCTMDMDRYLEPGWREKLEAAWKPETTSLFNRVVYRYNVDDPAPSRGWPAQNFHSRSGYSFKRAVHEALVYSGEQLNVSCQDIIMCEVQDANKPTRRQYLPLMELAQREDPSDSQICFWLAREYMWQDRRGEAAAMFEHYLALPSSTWGEERSEAMRYLARVRPDEKIVWLERARAETPHRREVWLDLAETFSADGDWLNLFWACANGIEKTHHTGSYLDDPRCWGPRLFELGAIAARELGATKRAVEWAFRAVEQEPGNEQLRAKLNDLVTQGVEEPTSA